MNTTVASKSSSLSIPSFLLTVATLTLTSIPSSAATMVGYYSLDNLTSGIQNQGTAGVTGNTLAPVGSGATLPTETTGFIGGGLQFNSANTTTLGALGTGNLGTINAYPFSMSIWLKTSASAGIAMSLSARASTDRYLGMGVAGGDAVVTRRNTTTQTTNSDTPVNDGEWHQIVASYSGSQNTQIYIDGKLVETDTTTTSGMMSSNTFVLGAILRQTSQLLSLYTGTMDDAGLFTGSTLTAAEVALVNGLGRTSSLGLDWLDEAYALSLAANGTTAVLGGNTWERFTSPSGTTGDYSGTATAGNAYILTDSSGNGIRVVPEPEPCLLMAIGLMGLFLRKRR